MKTIKTCITNPELVKVGQCCEVRMNTKWMEMNVDEPFIYLPAKIKDVNYKSNQKIPCVTLYVRRCAKRHNYWPVKNLMLLPMQIGNMKADGTIEDYQTIIFK